MPLLKSLTIILQKTMPKLSERLKLIASLVPNGARVCDIGTDHGYLSIELIKRKIARSVIATDINEKPLSRARKNIESSGAVGIELRLCDGLDGILADEVNTVIIAGMGGEVIAGIINRGDSVIKNNGTILLLQPTTSPEALREYLFKNGFEIIREEPLFENGKLYSVMVCKYSGVVREIEPHIYFIGRLTPETPEGALYIKKQYKRCFSCAKALEAIPQKKESYNHYNSVAEVLSSILDSVGE